MPRSSQDAPNRILSYKAVIALQHPLIAVLTLKTDEGTFEFAFNREVASGIRTAMGNILEPVDP
jgi:hypothetical protein